MGGAVAGVPDLAVSIDDQVVRPGARIEVIALEVAGLRVQEGEIVAAGPGRVTDDGTRIPMELSVGDKVIYSKYAGTEYKDGDDEYLILRESDVLAKLS